MFILPDVPASSDDIMWQISLPWTSSSLSFFDALSYCPQFSLLLTDFTSTHPYILVCPRFLSSCVFTLPHSGKWVFSSHLHRFWHRSASLAQVSLLYHSHRFKCLLHFQVPQASLTQILQIWTTLLFFCIFPTLNSKVRN